MAPYLYNSTQSLFVTYDDKRSIELKLKYAMKNGLGRYHVLGVIQ